MTVLYTVLVKKNTHISRFCAKKKVKFLYVEKECKKDITVRNFFVKKINVA